MSDQENWYLDGYEKCYYTGALGFIWTIVHKSMEKKYTKRTDLLRVIEVGTGQGQHFKFVRHGFSYYLATDIRPHLFSTFGDSRIESKFADASNLDFLEDASFDRLIATCLLAHLDQPMEALKEWKRVIKKGGVLTIYVPPEPGFLVRVIRKLFIWPKAKKHGLINPELVSYLEHRNHYPMMRSLIHEIFRDDRITKFRFPLKFLPWNLSVFDVYHIEKLK
jgi:phosphatidylethanolamine/phosphatidyl-N-methylethanolamine N-methyltransferase